MDVMDLNRADGVELTTDQRFRWGECPVCFAQHGEYCSPDVGISFGIQSREGVGVHLARLNGSPFRVKVVEVKERTSNDGR